MRRGVTLQINLAPPDLRHARTILPHQLRQWGAQVEEVVMTLDATPVLGRFSERWQEQLPEIRRLIDDVCAAHGHARSHEIDYSDAAARRLADTYCGGATAPRKDQYGAPVYGYLAGVAAASHRYVLHMDSDMLFGGGSQTWIGEAVEILEARPEVLACNPLPGPPTADGGLRSQTLEPDSHATLAFRTAHLSTRIFIIDVERLMDIVPIPLLRPRLHRAIQARLEAQPAVRPLEECISSAMVERGLIRVDFLGRSPGMWAAHPPYHSAHFLERLPEVVRRVESGDVPDDQRGRHEIDDSLVDWSDARLPRWRRWLDHVRLMASVLRARARR